MQGITSFISRRKIAAVAAAGALGIGAIALGGGSAFAAQTPPAGGVLNGTVIVTSTLTIQPAEGSFSMTAAPGTTTDATPFTVTIGSSDSAGYALTLSVMTPFGVPGHPAAIPNTDWTTDVWTGNQSLGYTPTKPAFDVGGDAITLFSTPNVSGNAGPQPTSQTWPWSNASADDVYTTDLHLTLPADAPGSPANGYTGAFQYEVIGG